MRGWLIFLACAAPLMLLNPMFWWLVGTETGASAVAYVRDGVRQDALLGPKAPWPEWARLPERYPLTVQSSFAAAPGQPATGVGDLEIPRTRREAVAEWRAELTAAGWQVTTVLVTTALPSLPPRQGKMCILTATRTEPSVRSIMIAIDEVPVGRVARIHWREAEPRSRPSRPDDGDC
jgi:hypothetical protein